MNLRYVGPEWSFLALLGSQNYQRLFKTIELHHEPLVRSHMCSHVRAS